MDLVLLPAFAISSAFPLFFLNTPNLLYHLYLPSHLMGHHPPPHLLNSGLHSLQDLPATTIPFSNPAYATPPKYFLNPTSHLHSHRSFLSLSPQQLLANYWDSLLPGSPVSNPSLRFPSSTLPAKIILASSAFCCFPNTNLSMLSFAHTIPFHFLRVPFFHLCT